MARYGNIFASKTSPFPCLEDPPPDSVSLRTAVLKEFSFIWREFCVCVMWRSSAYCVCVCAGYTHMH